MIVVRRHLPRRTVLRGLGTAVALPLLDAMVPAFASAAQQAVGTVRRFGVVYVPNGVNMADWTPATEGRGYALPRILTPLAPFRDRMLVLSGLSTNGVEGSGGAHAGPSTKFLTSTNPRRTFGSQVEAATSIDQIAADALGAETPIASLEVGLESFESVGSCDVGFSCAYTSTIAWRTPTTPLPMEHDPRAVFQRLLGDAGGTDAATRSARAANDRSILDSLTSAVSRLGGTLGPRDRAKLAEYLDAVRDVERRIQNVERRNAGDLPAIAQPIGVPPSFEEHARLMFDLQLIAYQADLTRVVTFMVAREFSGRTYPEIGAPDAHHPTSHHENLPARLEKISRINTFHAALFAYYLERLATTPEGNGSLLDSTILLYGAGMGDGNDHDTRRLPILLVGGGGRIAAGRHLVYPAGTPLANLHLVLLERLGVRTDAVGNSTGPLDGVAA
ncbi:MAG: DUF1552 domain-containing protein [Acidimicrobiia bacterium]|nr:DUF1552 domain-containing protein [Acidimicrobiia bacterium]